jgi:anti-sigma factor RsiW
MTTSEHPPAFRLDAHVAGDLDPAVTAHLAHCKDCAAYVAETTTAAAAFAAAEGKRAAEFVLALGDRSESKKMDTKEQRRWITNAPWMVAPLLAAAAVLFLVRTGTPPLSPASEVGPAVRFKGKIQLAVVRDRSGDQSRVATEVHVRPNDRLRVEVSVDDAAPLQVGFLGKDGTWIHLLTPAIVEAGTHLSERAAQFDETPTEGWILAGHPDDVNRAKLTRTFDDVSVIPILREP